MHDGGEADARSVYCAASVASLTGLMKECQDIFADSPHWIVKLVNVVFVPLVLQNIHVWVSSW